MDAAAVPHFRNGGPTAAAQTFGARERHTRGDAATMVDVTAGQGTAGSSGFPSLSEIGSILKRGDIALAFGILIILVVLILPLPSIVSKYRSSGEKTIFCSKVEPLRVFMGMRVRVSQILTPLQLPPDANRSSLFEKAML